MNTPDFNRAQYLDTSMIGRPSGGGPNPRQIAAAEAFPMAVVLGIGAAIICTVAYAFVWSFGFMLSIIAIGFAWFIVRAMLTVSHGNGGKLYQIAAVVLTYFTVTCGKILLPVWSGMHNGHPIPVPIVLEYALFGPILRLQTGLSGILGILVLGYALRMAWREAKGTQV